MVPDQFRKYWGFVAIISPLIVLLAATPALAQGADDTTNIAFVCPLAIAAGTGTFALIAAAVLRKVIRNEEVSRHHARERISGLRAMVDEYEALLSGGRELTILWNETSGGSTRIFGQADAVLPLGRQPESVLNLSSWLNLADAEHLAQLIEELRVHGHNFDITLNTLDGRAMRANGWILGDGSAMRLRPTFWQSDAGPDPVATTTSNATATIHAILSALRQPAFARDANDRLIYANAAYHKLAAALYRVGTDEAPPELLDTNQLHHHLTACAQGNGCTVTPVEWAEQGQYELVEFDIPGGRAGYLHPVPKAILPASETRLNPVDAIIGALNTPIIIFNARRELVQFNEAYAKMWNLSRQFLAQGIDERTILDKLRTEGMLPNQVDYKIWRDKHLESYRRKAPFEADPWHLPDGRTVRVFSAPASPGGGVVYVFEDITERLQLESTNKAFFRMQRETINALNEAVAVFGTNGRLSLSNPRLSALWKLPMEELGQRPHIDRIAETCGQTMPEDGASIWHDLKRSIIDLNPTRSDQTGRISRADGRLLDYAITRLPDGQTMMTFLDVTESASYSKVLKERNDALVTADLLKDAFVQNISYELRSPLTNIIGFADLLANDNSILGERQRAYIEYIRTSSVTLGVLIDNILDLASVDAGIVKLQPELLDVAALVDKARTGLSAAFPEVSGEKPINLVVDIEPNLPPFIADGTRIVQVLYNLLSNAARFSSPDGEIHLAIRHRANRLLFIIDDDGPGLAAEMQAAIQTRINTAAGRQRGAALGLSIVRTFVNLHGGTISAEKREPHGSRIIINLPCDTAIAGVAE